MIVYCVAQNTSPQKILMYMENTSVASIPGSYLHDSQIWGKQNNNTLLVSPATASSHMKVVWLLVTQSSALANC